MAARKLQQEMDRVFKRVGEGIVLFDGIYEKLQMASNPSQKEKLEQDLKREIKKLQKLRDQIKTWIGSNDIRDKKQLIEQRKLIETDMERFKAVERELKTKAYSREGLNNGAKADPHEKEKRQAIDFIQQQTDELEQQIETLDGEQESIQGTMKKGKRDNAKQERIGELEHLIDRHKWHVSRMELMIRMIENDTLAPESVMDLQDDIVYYVESNQDADFAEDEAIYDDLNLVENEEDAEILEPIVRDDTYTLEDLAQDLSKEKEKEEKEKEKERDSFTDKLSPSPAPAGIAKSKSASPPAPESRDTRADSKLANTPSAPPSQSTGPSEKIPHGLNPLPPPSIQQDKRDTPKKIRSRDSPVPTPVHTPLQQAHSQLHQQGLNIHHQSPAGSAIRLPSVSTPSQAFDSIGSIASAPHSVTSTPMAPASGLTAPRQHQQPTQRAAPNLPPMGDLPPGLRDLVHCFDAARERLVNPLEVEGGAASIAKLIESSYLNCPDATLADLPREYHPESPYPTPVYYPSEVLATLEDPEIFAKMDVDTLFYIFYYRQRTHQQYLAAKELKNRNWRFHKRFLTWFQRHEEPKIINNDFEQGTYRFFDFEGSWLQRRKTNFKFEYQYLEDEI